MMHRAWSSIVEVPNCLSRSYIKFQGHTALKIVEFDPNWAFPDCNSSLNSPMAMKCCTKLETAKERCPIVFQGHSSNFKVTRYKTSPILTQIGRFRTIGRSQLSNPSDLPCFLILTEKMTNPSFRYEGEGFHRSSSNSSLNSMLSPEGEPHIRTCGECRILLERRDQQIEQRNYKPPICQIYEVTGIDGNTAVSPFFFSILCLVLPRTGNNFFVWHFWKIY